MSFKKVLINMLIVFIFSGCFKLGYQIQLGSSQNFNNSSYDAFYRSPAFYNK